MGRHPRVRALSLLSRCLQLLPDHSPRLFPSHEHRHPEEPARQPSPQRGPTAEHYPRQIPLFGLRQQFRHSVPRDRLVQTRVHPATPSVHIRLSARSAKTWPTRRSNSATAAILAFIETEAHFRSLKNRLGRASMTQVQGLKIEAPWCQDSRMICALPTRFSAGTKPTPMPVVRGSTRLSEELSRLSPIMK